MFVGEFPCVFGVAGVAAAATVTLLARGNKARRAHHELSTDCDLQVACYQPTRTWALGSGECSAWGSARAAEVAPASRAQRLHLAIIGEELGLVGTLPRADLFGLLAAAFLRLVARHPDPFVKSRTAAIGSWVIGQALVNIAVVIGLAPVVGIPLPLVSAGGSALIVTMAAMGVVIAFARSEPGAAEALAARPGVLRRSLAVLGRPGAADPAPGRTRG